MSSRPVVAASPRVVPGRARVSALVVAAMLIAALVAGPVLSVGVLIPVTKLDNWLAWFIERASGANRGLLISSGIAALVFAYLARFLTVALQNVEASLSKITPSMDDAARSLGLTLG